LESSVLEDCDIVVLAIPVVAMDKILETGFKTRALVTDVGSVKGSSVSAYRKALADGCQYHYVPAHPIAGDERSGPEAARCGLFEGARVILTPVGESGPEEATVSKMWESLGGVVQYMDPLEHDTVFAWVSHMPHMAAYAIIDSVLGENPGLVDLSGGGLRDYTRIAASSPRMWAEIAVANREKIITATRGLKGSVERIIAALERGDQKELERIFEGIAAVRRSDS
jgi:prephenate dehydrogenase